MGYMTDESGPSLLARHEPRTGPDEGLVVDVLGVAVNPLTMSGAVAAIEHWIDTDRRSFACVTGVHGVMVAQDDPEFGAVYERAGLVTPDGMPLVWACHHAGYPDTERVYGPDLMLAVCQRAVARAWRAAACVCTAAPSATSCSAAWPTPTLLFPSFHDNSAWVIGEALSLGRPVVCLQVGDAGEHDEGRLPGVYACA